MQERSQYASSFAGGSVATRQIRNQTLFAVHGRGHSSNDRHQTGFRIISSFACASSWTGIRRRSSKMP